MKVAIAQITSIPDPERNLRLCRRIIQKAVAKGAELVVFPESSDVIFGPGCESDEERKELKRTTAFRDGVKEAAKESKVYVVFGCHMPCEKDDKMWCNSCLTYDPSGELVHRYDKLHPCEAKLPDMDVSESKSCVPGEADQAGLELLEITSRDGEKWKFGVTICYDIRYPQLFTFLRGKGAEAFIISTAWFPTTRRHWDPLLTTRAIDNQAYAIAPAQVGSHHEERESLGASAVIDPWGDKVVRLPSIADRKDGQKKTNGEIKTNGSNGDVKKNGDGPNGVVETTDTSYAHNGNGKTHHAPAGDIEVGSDGEWEDLGNDEDGGPGVAIGYAVLRKEKVNDLREMVPVWENLRTEVYGKPDGR